LKTSDGKLEYKIILPESELSDFVERFYIVMNTSASDKEVILIPDGRIDLFFIVPETGRFIGTIIGIETQPTTASFPPKSIFIGISLKLLSIEYVLHTTIAEILNGARKLPDDFWSITRNDLNNFDSFCNKISNCIRGQIKHEIDDRKRKLFNHIYETNGALKVKEYAQYVFWSERQINRYFNLTFGLSLKAFCNILRFKASFQHIKEGNLFPEQNFADQAHFIREVKRLTKVTPKRLAKNENDRFIQFSTLPPE
jgi:AraC-like DNA-binding protein